MQPYNLRLEEQRDWDRVERLTREAFWREERLREQGFGCDEHLLVRKLRAAPEFLPELDYVAEADGEVVGHVLYSRAEIRCSGGGVHPVITFGPLSVLPAWQKKGVGSALMRHTLAEAARLGHGAVVFFGHPTYYPRFGFREAGDFGLTTPDGRAFPAFMAMELREGELDGVSGSFYESPLFSMDPEEVKAFDKGFQAR